MVQRTKARLGKRRKLAVLFVGLGLAVPAIATAAPGEPQGEFAFTGTYRGAGQVLVTQRDEFAIQYGLLGGTGSLTCVDGAIQVADLNGDGDGTLADVQPGDTVLVLTELPLRNPLSACYARLLIDQTHPPS